MVNMTTHNAGKIISFYSYKGGTGRSMALANIAYILATSPEFNFPRVLMIDWDLEAPGLHHFFYDNFEESLGKSLKVQYNKKFDSAKGLIDFLTDVDKFYKSELPGKKLPVNRAFDKESVNTFRKLLAAIDFNGFIMKIDGPSSLYLMKAGAGDVLVSTTKDESTKVNFSNKVKSFGWEYFYLNYGSFFTLFRKYLQEQFDFVLIDSRTGLTDTSGICTRVMPEILVAVFVPNKQNISGLTMVLKKVLSYREESRDPGGLLVFPVASRIDGGNESLRTIWWKGGKFEGIEVEGYQPIFESLIKNIYKIDKCNLEEYFEQTQIPYDPSYAFGERIAAAASLEDRLSIGYACYNLAKWLIRGDAPWEGQPVLSTTSAIHYCQLLLQAIIEGSKFVGKKVVDRIISDRYERFKSHLIEKLSNKQKNAAELMELFEKDPETYQKLMQKLLVSVEAEQELVELAKEILEFRIEVDYDKKKALIIYMNSILKSRQYLSLRGLDLTASDPASFSDRINLSNIYVSLNTILQPEQEKTEKIDERTQLTWPSRALSATEAMCRYRHVVLLGEPGSGKSTFITMMISLLANEYGDENIQGSEKSLLPNDLRNLVPIFIALRDLAHYAQNKNEEASASFVWSFIEEQLKRDSLEIVERALRTKLADGQCIIFMDGLDEIVDQEKREYIKQSIELFRKRFSQNRFVITCRTMSYQDSRWHLENVSITELAPFTDEQINKFLTAWYKELERVGQVDTGRSDALSNNLKEAIAKSGLQTLAQNPLMLTVMTMVHTHKGNLPEARSLLYGECIDILLYRWDEVRMSNLPDAPRLSRFLSESGVKTVDVLQVLSEQAFSAQQGQLEKTGQDALTDLPEHRLLRTFANLKGDGRDLNWAQAVVDTIKTRAGLLIERTPGIFSFPHRTFQEYFAGRYLASKHNLIECILLLIDELAFWRESILLAMGILVFEYNQTDRVLAAMAELCPYKEPDSENEWKQVWLAGDIVQIVQPNRMINSQSGRELLQRIQKRLVELIQTNKLEMRERVEAGNSLGRIGDPRFRKDFYYLPEEPLLGFIEILEGEFVMGTSKEDLERQAKRIGFVSKYREDEIPAHPVYINKYFIGRYPVTVDQFQSFVRESGYTPRNPDSLKGVATHPVSYVTWYDALAYCAWLHDTLKDNKNTPDVLRGLLNKKKWRITLPSEAEWEKAARGEGQTVFPWGDDIDTTRANYYGAKIDEPSTVGCFPAGVNAFGLLDMSGNVWEWTRSHYKVYPYKAKESEDLNDGDDVARVLRGGSFGYHAGFCRCAYRYRYYPNYWSGDLGFRVVLSPILPSDL